MFAFFYTLALSLLYVAAIPFLVPAVLRGKYRQAVPARFFLWHNPPLPEGGIWFHVCSLGEARALHSLVKRFDPSEVRMTATTQTGFDAVSRMAPGRSGYLPFEPLIPFWSRAHKVLVVMEAELWYLLFRVAKKKGAKTILVNARISDRSWPRYRRFGWLYRRIFKAVDLVYAQTETDRQRLEALGAANVRVTGNIKFADIPSPSRKLARAEGLLVCAGSTHEGEEGIVMEAFRKLKKVRPQARLAIVPRHPERFSKVARMAESFARLQGWSFSRFSECETLESDLVLVDMMGELVNCYAVSDVVVLGGAFEAAGGHNAAEAAQFGIPVVSGPNYFNQKELFAGIEGITIVSGDELGDVLQYPNLLPGTRIMAERDPLKEIEKEIRNVLQS